MKFMLDTNTCIYVIKQKFPEVLRHIKKHSPGDIGISTITLSELYYGAAKSQRVQKNREALSEFLIPLEIVDFDERAANVYGNIRAELEKIGKPIGGMDILIASHALSIDVTLVTNNVKEFRRIKKLRVVDWSKKKRQINKIMIE